jgi:hypothetical protein
VAQRDGRTLLTVEDRSQRSIKCPHTWCWMRYFPGPERYLCEECGYVLDADGRVVPDVGPWPHPEDLAWALKSNRNAISRPTGRWRRVRPGLVGTELRLN